MLLRAICYCYHIGSGWFHKGVYVVIWDGSVIIWPRNVIITGIMLLLSWMGVFIFESSWFFMLLSEMISDYRTLFINVEKCGTLDFFLNCLQFSYRIPPYTHSRHSLLPPPAYCFIIFRPKVLEFPNSRLPSSFRYRWESIYPKNKPLQTLIRCSDKMVKRSSKIHHAYMKYIFVCLCLPNKDFQLWYIFLEIACPIFWSAPCIVYSVGWINLPLILARLPVLLEARRAPPHMGFCCPLAGTNLGNPVHSIRPTVPM